MVVLGRRATALLYRQTFRRALELEWREELQQAEEVLHRWGLPQLEEAGFTGNRRHRIATSDRQVFLSRH